VTVAFCAGTSPASIRRGCTPPSRPPGRTMRAARVSAVPIASRRC